MTDDRPLTVQEAREWLRVSEKLLLRLLREGKIPGRRVGREWRISRRALEHYVEGKEPTQ